MWQYPSELFVWKTQLSSEEGPAARVLDNSEEQKRALNSFTIVPFLADTIFVHKASAFGDGRWPLCVAS